MSGGVRARAIEMASRRLVTAKGARIIRPGRARYSRTPTDNLIPSVSKDDFWQDLSGGDGSELEDRDNAPAKFCAAHSSSALCVNVFGPFRHGPQHLALGGLRGFDTVRFEQKCSTGLGGTPPNLDLLALGDSVVIGVESKFLEPLTSKPAKFSNAYDALMRTAGAGWRRVFSELKQDPARFTSLDAAQLIKHYLGLRHTYGGTGRRVVLHYLFWEPSDALVIPDYQHHRQEVEQFTDYVSGDAVGFSASSYPRLWADWERESTWPGMHDHLAALRQRYDFALSV